MALYEITTRKVSTIVKASSEQFQTSVVGGKALLMIEFMIRKAVAMTSSARDCRDIFF